ncbi:MAG: ATP12 family protein [Pseudomonadota bacterium]
MSGALGGMPGGIGGGTGGGAGVKRFWQTARVIESDGGYEVLLDARPIRTPGKAPLALPTRALAEALAAEWEAQTERVDPATMPLTRSANTAIDRVVPHRAAVVAEIAGYGETDLLCYRAPHPEGLIAEQRARWDPMLDWAAERHGARLSLAEGVMFAAQPPEALARLTAAVDALDAWVLTGLHPLVTISGSLVLGLACAEGRLDADETFAISRVDEDWNIREWGEDEEAAAQAARRLTELREATRWLSLLR